MDWAMHERQAALLLERAKIGVPSDTLICETDEYALIAWLHRRSDGTLHEVRTLLLKVTGGVRLQERSGGCAEPRTPIHVPGVDPAISLYSWDVAAVDRGDEIVHLRLASGTVTGAGDQVVMISGDARVHAQVRPLEGARRFVVFAPLESELSPAQLFMPS